MYNKFTTLALALLITFACSVASIAAPPAVNKAAKDSTAMVTCKVPENMIMRGSAAYIGGDMFITNHHVIDGALSISISVPGTDVKHKAKLIYTNMLADVAILVTEKKVTGLKPVTFAIGDDIGGTVYAAGYGSSMHDDLPGEFLRVYGGGTADYSLKNDKWYRFGGEEGCSISGDSGGPAFNKDGEYIGPIWGTDKTNTYAVRNRTILAIFGTL
jgi:S1-C subfamily serine protease